MSETNIAQEISRITTARNTIRNKVVNLFGNNHTTDDITALASVIDGIVNQGAVSAEVQEGSTYTIPAGYHNGSGVVAGASGGGNYQLQTKTVTPTKAQQNVTPDAGKYGLSAVTVEAIPAAYQDVTSVTAQASQVLATKVFVDSTGNNVAGTMVDNGAVNQVISVAVPSYTIPSGYHSGSGTVSITTETKNVTPTTSQQVINATSGKVISSVTVGAIPAEYQDVTGVTTTPSQVLEGTYFVNSSGSVLEGTMAINSAETIILDAGFGVNWIYEIPEGYHNGEGIVKIVRETKTVTPSSSSQDVTPSEGKVLSKVTVAAIPSPYYNVSNVTATASDVVASKVFVNASGSEITGTMVDRGTITTQTLSTTTTNYTIPSGKHSGSGKVQIVLEEKSATPSTTAQNITPTSGKVLSKVTVAAIPAPYYDVSGVTATASDVLAGTSIVLSNGTLVEGTIVNNGATTGTINGLSTMSYTIASGYTSGGTVSLTSDIETALASI